MLPRRQAGPWRRGPIQPLLTVGQPQVNKLRQTQLTLRFAGLQPVQNFKVASKETTRMQENGGQRDRKVGSYSVCTGVECFLKGNAQVTLNFNTVFPSQNLRGFRALTNILVPSGQCPSPLPTSFTPMKNLRPCSPDDSFEGSEIWASFSAFTALRPTCERSR